MEAMEVSSESHNLAPKDQVVSGEIDPTLPRGFQDHLLPSCGNPARLVPTGHSRCLAIKNTSRSTNAAKSAHHQLGGLDQG